MNQTIECNQRYISAREAAAALRLSAYRVRQLLKDGKICGVRPGRTGNWRIPENELQKYLNPKD